MTKTEWMEKNGFNAEGFTWIICGGDTFVIKEDLKELGFKFSPILKWHIAEEIEIPEGYHLLKIHFDEAFEWNDTYKSVFSLVAAKEKIEDRMRVFDAPSLSEWVGTEGERLRNIEVKYISQRSFDTRFGWTNLHTFKRGEDILIWFTQKDLDFEEGQTVLLTGTVKKHDEYKGAKNTQLSRCIIKNI